MFGITGRKGRAGGLSKSDVKAPGSTWEWHLILEGLSTGEESGIPSVEVKFVDIGKNTGGEGGSLDRN